MDVNHRLEELETLNAIGEVLNREPSFEVALQAALERLVALTGVSTGWVFLARTEHGDPHTSTFRLAAATGLPPALDAEEEGPLRCGSCECMGEFRRSNLDEGTNIVTCSRLEAAEGDKQGLVVHASVPLLGRNAPVGILNLASPGDAPFGERTLALLTAVGRQLGIAFERGRAVEERQCEAEHVAALEERNRVARDIHDSVTQLLFGAHLALEVARAGSDDDGRAAIDAVERGAGLVESALGELRGLVELLRTADLDQGLYPALVRLHQRVSHGNVRIHLDADQVDVPTDVAGELYRVVQEAVHNALKHADARNVWIRLAETAGRLVLAVEDDGRGFPDTLTRGVGLDSIEDRADAVGGSLVLGTSDCGGALVSLEVPWPSAS